MEHINPTNPLLGAFEKFEQSVFAVKRWETARVDWTLRRLKLLDKRKEILRETGGLAFADFNRVIPFPIHLFSEAMIGMKPIHRDPKAIHPMWFKSFAMLPFVQKYGEVFDKLVNAGIDKPIGMVFPRKGFAQGLILHNGSPDHFVPPKSGCHFYRGGTKHKVNLVVQVYSNLIDHVVIEHGWSV